jgi:lipoprotein-anchoring transpeptidase ErfK/SrfK
VGILRVSFLAAVVLVACSGGGQEGFVLVEPGVSSSGQVDKSVAPPTTATTTTRLDIPDYQTAVVRASAAVKIFVSPTVGVETRTVPADTILGTPTVMPVLEGPVGGWVKLSLPGRPNESNGWARADQFEFSHVDQRIEVDLSALSLTFYEKGDPVITTPVAIGSPTNPTPAGEFFLTDIVALTDPSGPWGPYALGLSARSDTITEFNGGDGIIGIHGTNRPDRIGEPVSLGCVRVPNEIIAQIAGRVQLGIPVSIG